MSGYCVKRITTFHYLVMVVVATSAMGNEEGILEKQLPSRKQRAYSQPLFQAHPPERTGIHFANQLQPPHEKFYLTNGSGVALGDIDDDGLVDIFLCGADVDNRLYRQVAPFQFEDITDKAGVGGGDSIGAGAAMADIDNDGDLDIYVCTYLDENQLFINRGDGTFIESGYKWNLNYNGPTTMAAFGDYDRDGDLDVYLLNNRKFRIEEEDYKSQIKIKDGKAQIPKHMFFLMNGHLCRNGMKDLLLRNDGSEFTIVNKSAGIEGYGMGLSATWWDYNDDGWPDLWVANDLKSPDHLYRNNGDGSFTDVLPSMTSYMTWNSMGADFADFNRDGRFDFLATDMSATTHFKSKVNMGEMETEAWFLGSAEPRQLMRNCLFINNGTSRFMEVAFASGLASTDWTWSVKCRDFDNDGRTDVFVTNGMVNNANDSDWGIKWHKLVEAGKRDEARKLVPPQLHEANIAFRNEYTPDGGGSLDFANVSRSWGLDHVGISHGAAVGDLDRDGDLDIVVNNYGEPASIYENTESEANRVVVSVRGTTSNRFGIGSRVSIQTVSGIQTTILSLSRGYMSSDEPLIHFGLGNDAQIDTLKINWPSGLVQTLEELKANKHYTITEPDGKADARPVHVRPILNGLFADVAESNNLEFRHQESDYDDFARELLLPNRLSTFGPGIAWGDADGDGDDDVYIGGAAGQSAELFRYEDGQFSSTFGQPWQEDKASEDMGALWLDADSDGDLDLYVVSGGNECEPGDEMLRDRLYLNNGKGGFHKAPPEYLPDVADSGSVVAAGDYDHDGDLDLFVGSRLIPGRYPEAPASRLLKNESGRFSQAAADDAPGLAEAGLVTGAVWADVNHDGWSDLLVTSEWGPIRLFVNEQGQFSERTNKSGLGGATGWWNGIAGGDIDADGDIDFVATNFGLNTKYGSPTPDKPLALYFRDFDDDGKLDIVEAKADKKHGMLPVRGRSCSCAQLPHLKDKFPSFRQFASASLGDIYADRGLDEAGEYLCTELRSVVLWNDGNGHFEIRPLPFLQQIAPAFGVAITDFDADGKLDIYTTHNFYGPQVETGRMSGGLGALLRGKGNQEFEWVRPAESGLVVPEDARAVAVCNLNGDNWPDLTIACSNGPLRVFRHVGNSNRSLRVQLLGTRGNLRGVGARIGVTDAGGKRQIVQVSSGSGYLAQSGSDVFLGLGSEKTPRELVVVWPDGKKSRQSISETDDFVSVLHPDLR